MNGQVTKVKMLDTKDGIGYLITFALETGKSARTWIMTRYGNYQNWKQIIDGGKGTPVAGLTMKNDTLINADCAPMIRKLIAFLLPIFMLQEPAVADDMFFWVKVSIPGNKMVLEERVEIIIPRDEETDIVRPAIILPKGTIIKIGE